MDAATQADINEEPIDWLRVIGAVALGFCVLAVYARLFARAQTVQPHKPQPDQEEEPPIDIDPIREPVVDPAGQCPRHSEAPKSTVLAVAEPIAAEIKETKTPFEHSEDFRALRFNGALYRLTGTQARVVERLFEAHQSGLPEIHQSKLLEDLGVYSKRLRDVFKADLDVYRALIGKGKRKGTFFLNV